MKYKTVPGVIMTSVCGQHYLASPTEIIKINDTAAFCWEILKQGATQEELAARICEYYEAADTDVINRDVHKLIGTLLTKRLIVRCSQ